MHNEVQAKKPEPAFIPGGKEKTGELHSQIETAEAEVARKKTQIAALEAAEIPAPAETLTPEEVNKLVETNKDWAQGRVPATPSEIRHQPGKLTAKDRAQLKQRDKCKAMVAAGKMVSGIGDTGHLDYLEQRPESKLSEEAKRLLRGLPRDRDLPAERNLAGLEAAQSVSDVEAPLDETKEFAHSDDYREIRWMGTEYALTLQQAQIIEKLHQAHEAGLPNVGTKVLWTVSARRIVGCEIHSNALPCGVL